MILRNSKWIGPQSQCSGETGANFIERPIEMPRKESERERDRSRSSEAAAKCVAKINSQLHWPSRRIDLPTNIELEGKKFK